jgi:hypothetical protein
MQHGEAMTEGTRDPPSRSFPSDNHEESRTFVPFLTFCKKNPRRPGKCRSNGGPPHSTSFTSAQIGAIVVFSSSVESETDKHTEGL